MEAGTTPISGIPRPVGTGGFLNPDRVVMEFGLTEGMSVADFGTGAGFFTILIAKLVGKDGKVYGLDVQETALDIVRSKARSAGVENVDTIRANLEVWGSSGLNDSSQDMVVIANVLFQSPRKQGIMKEAYRVLKSGMTMIIIDWKKGTDGIGPPDDLRTNMDDMTAMAQSEGFSFVKEINAGAFHYGMIFKKQ